MGARWDEEDDALLLEWLAEGVDGWTIAGRLGRTRQAVYQRAWSLRQRDGGARARAALECVACGRRLTNDVRAPNAAAWTAAEPREPYCADSADCLRDAYGADLAEMARRQRRGQ